MSNVIIFNGKEYNSLEEMPPEARQQYQQAFQNKNRDGVPDVFEQFGQVNPAQPVGKTSPRPLMPVAPVHTAEGIPFNVWLVKL